MGDWMLEAYYMRLMNMIHMKDSINGMWVRGLPSKGWKQPHVHIQFSYIMIYLINHDLNICLYIYKCIFCKKKLYFLKKNHNKKKKSYKNFDLKKIDLNQKNRF